MGQTINKLKGKEDEAQVKKQLEHDIREILEKKEKEFGESVGNWKENYFYQAVYEIVEELNERSGAMQFRLPSMKVLQKVYNDNRKSESEPLKKEELQKIVRELIKIDSFYVGKSAKDAFLFIFGVPVVAMLAKRILPGPTASISDDVFIPAATAGTVYYLAKINKL